MIVRKITVCSLLFAVLLMGAVLLDKHISRIHYPDSKVSPFSYNDNINILDAQETERSTRFFFPREYIRILHHIDE